MTQTGGTLETNSAVTTLAILAGTHTHKSGTVTTLTIDGGTCYYLGTGTITTLKVGSDATIDFSRDLRAKTVTNAAQLYAGATVSDPNAVVTWSAGLKLNRCTISEVNLDVGQDRTVTPS